MSSDAVLIDGYVDEPACLGVPPYVAPEVRGLAGVLFERGYAVRYLTIDRLRLDLALLGELDRSAERCRVIAGGGRLLDDAVHEDGQVGRAVEDQHAVVREQHRRHPWDDRFADRRDGR